MMENCLQAALLNNLSSDYGISVRLESGSNPNSAGTFDPCDYSITFPSSEKMTNQSITAELFHAYQEQYLNGKLNQIVNDFTNNHIGGANVEFEEAAMLMFVGMIQNEPFVVGPGQEGLRDWLFDLEHNHDFSSEVILTEIEVNAWFEAMEVFRQYWYNLDPDRNDLYGKSIDRNLLPDTLLDLLNKSNCINPY